MTNLTRQREISVIKLVDMNEERPDSSTCARRINCVGIQCCNCPLEVDGTTLGEVRELDPRNNVSGCQRSPDDAGPTPVEDPSVKQPSYYQVFDGLESISVIARSMTVEQFKGFCMGNVLKYRLRAGKKSDQANVTKDLAKAEFYKELFEKHKGECHVAE